MSYSILARPSVVETSAPIQVEVRSSDEDRTEAVLTVVAQEGRSLKFPLHFQKGIARTQFTLSLKGQYLLSVGESRVPLQVIEHRNLSFFTEFGLTVLAALFMALFFLKRSKNQRSSRAN